MPRQTSYSPITAQVGSSKEPKGLMYMVEIQDLALREPIAGVRLDVALLAWRSALLGRVHYHACDSILKLLNCLCH